MMNVKSRDCGEKMLKPSRQYFPPFPYHPMNDLVSGIDAIISTVAPRLYRFGCNNNVPPL